MFKRPLPSKSFSLPAIRGSDCAFRRDRLTFRNGTLRSACERQTGLLAEVGIFSHSRQHCRDCRDCRDCLGHPALPSVAWVSLGRTGAVGHVLTPKVRP